MLTAITSGRSGRPARFAIVLALIGCSADDDRNVQNSPAAPAPAPVPLADTPPKPAESPDPPPDPPAVHEHEGPTIEFACPAVPSTTRSCDPTTAWIVELAAATKPLFNNTHGAPWRSFCDRAKAAMLEGLEVAPDSLSWEERVLAQNLAMRMALSLGCVDAERPPDEPPLDQLAWGYQNPSWVNPQPGHGTVKPTEEAARLVAHLAFSAERLDELGGEPMADIDAWIGPREEWVVRETRNFPLFHDQVEGFTRSFSTVRGPERRAVFSRLVAIDTEYRPHVTPLVGRVEIRNGLEDDASACVAKLEATRVRCQDARLHVATPVGLAPNMFLRFATPDRVTCIECHGDPSNGSRAPDDLVFGDLKDIVGRPATRHLAKREKAFLGEAKQQAERLRGLISTESK